MRKREIKGRDILGGVVTDTSCQRASQSLFETIAVSQRHEIEIKLALLIMQRYLAPPIRIAACPSFYAIFGCYGNSL